MRSPLILLLLVACHVCSAQFIKNNNIIPSGYYYGMGKSYVNKTKINGVKEQENACYSDKGKLAWKRINMYNKQGHVIENKQYKKGKLKHTYLYLYYNDTLYTGNVTLNKKGDTTFESRYEYDEKGRRTKYVQAKRFTKSETRYTYNAKGEKKKSVLYRRNKAKWTYEYVYNNDGKMVKTLQYNAKNKLVRQTTYQCDYLGETIRKDVKQASMCLRKDSSQNDGGYIIYDDRTDEKGRIARVIYKYDKDTNLVSYESFPFKRRFTTKQVYSYDASGNVTGMIAYRKNKLWYSYRYNYNLQNMVVVSNYISKEGEVKSIQLVQYKYF
ncbi:MAG: hypothetical protein V4658_10900 [Bacteroidota bacterium]